MIYYAILVVYVNVESSIETDFFIGLNQSRGLFSYSDSLKEVRNKHGVFSLSYI